MSQRSKFVASKLYSDFMDVQFEADLKKAAQSRNMAEVERLLQQKPNHPGLLFARTWFGAAPMSSKVEYLVEKAERLEMLQQWEPGSEFASLRELVGEVCSEADQLMTAAQLLSRVGVLKFDFVKNPVLKQVLVEYVKLKAFLPPTCDVLCLDQLFVELLELKLGVSCHAKDQTFTQNRDGFQDADRDFVKAMWRMASSKGVKSGYPIHSWLKQEIDILKAEDEEQRKKNKAKEDEGAGPKPAETQAAGSKPNPESGTPGEPAEREWQIGDRAPWEQGSRTVVSEAFYYMRHCFPPI